MANQFERPGITINETLAPLPGNPGVPGRAVAAFAANYFMGPTVPTFVQSWNDFTQTYGSFAASGGSYLHYAVYQYFNNGGTGCYVLAIPNVDATTASVTLADIKTPTADNLMTVSALSPGAWGNGLYVAVSSAGNTGRFNLQVFQGGTSAVNQVENFIDLSINPTDARNVLTVVNSPISGSKYIKLAISFPTGGYSAGVTDLAIVGPTNLAGGGNGATPPNMVTAVPAGFDQLQGRMLNVNVPALTTAGTINALITWASSRGDVMIVVDGPAPNFPESSAQVVNNYVNMVTGGSAITASTYAALYAPWIQITNPASSLPGSAIWVPPGGAVLGIWAATDASSGPWQSPAGTKYGLINLINIETQFTSTDLDTLNLNNINAIRFVPGYAPAIMGVRTLQQSYPSRYLSVRRMLIQLEHDLTVLLQPMLFQPNDQALWDQITSMIENYLNNLMQQGVLAGFTQSTAYQVICDSSNNSPSSAGSGIVNVSVAVALLAPAEFIVINISQLQSTGATTISTSA